MISCRWRGVAVWAIALAVTWTGLARGQTASHGQPIYPAYQGYVENPDGSLTMVFQYFSHGRDPVAVPVGPKNRFTGEEDRNQPITFLPGNHEFVCVIVVESRDAAAQLRWTVAFPETESTTSVDTLNLEYLLTERSQGEANRDLDLKTASRGVCVNKPPRVATNRLRRLSESGEGEIEQVKAILGKELQLRGSAEDEGLPRGSEVIVEWRKLSGPGEVTFGDATKAETGASFSVEGSYELELAASDGELASSDRIRVEVAASSAP